MLVLVMGKRPGLARRHVVSEQQGVLAPELGLEVAWFLAEGLLLARRHRTRERASSSFLASQTPHLSLSSSHGSTPVTVLSPAPAFFENAGRIEKAD